MIYFVILQGKSIMREDEQHSDDDGVSHLLEVEVEVVIGMGAFGLGEIRGGGYTS